MNVKDFLLPFMIANHCANGGIVHLNDSLQKIITLHNYPEIVSRLLSELLVINCFLGRNLKDQGTITCQIRSDDGVVKLLVTEFCYNGGIRGYASFDEDKFIEKDYSFKELIGSGQLVVTYDALDHRYQGVIELCSDTLASSFEEYLKKSEQIKSVVVIATKLTNIFDELKITSVGIILKKMPESYMEAEDDWVKYTYFISSVSQDELLSTEPSELLRRLFHSDGVLVHDKTELEFKCRCSREKMQSAMSGIPSEEIEALKVDGEIVIKCQFCSKEERF